MLTLDLTEAETDQLMKAVDRSLKDAVYYGRYWEEKYSQTLMEKLVAALLGEKQAKTEPEEENDDDDFMFELF